MHLTVSLLKKNNLQRVKSCTGPNQFIVSNGHGLEVKSVGNSRFQSNVVSTSILKLVDLLNIPKITRNLIFVSKFAKYNHVYFEFHFLKYQEFIQVLIEDS